MVLEVKELKEMADKKKRMSEEWSPNKVLV